MKEVQRIAQKEALITWQHEGKDTPEHFILGNYLEDKWVDSVSSEETIKRYLISNVNVKLCCLSLEDWNGKFYSCYSCTESISKKFSLPRIKTCEVRIFPNIIYNRLVTDSQGLMVIHCLVTREYLDS